MDLNYKGPLKLDQVVAKAIVSEKRADVSSEYHFRNPTRKVCNPRFKITRTGISKLAIRSAADARPTPDWANSIKLKKTTIKTLSSSVSGLSNSIVDFDYSSQIQNNNPNHIRHFQYVPNLSIDEKQVCEKVDRYSLTVELPSKAKHIVKTSIAPTRLTKQNGKIVCHFEQANAYMLPISIKWTEKDVHLSVSKSVRELRGNILEITVRTVNKGSKSVRNLILKDDYSETGAGNIPGDKKVKKITPKDRSTRYIWTEKCNLAAGEKKTFKYKIIKQGIGTSVPPTIATLGGEIVGLSESEGFYPIPQPAISQGTAFALPSGWSFDFTDDDHHLNEHGMWNSEPIYDRKRQRLSWSTGCIYADKNFDDDYRWSVSNQVVRFSSGVGIHRDTPWLAKTGSISIHNGEFSHDDLKKFDKVVVLIRGWRFDFTDDDHKINKMLLKIQNTRFDKKSGRVKWRTRVSYADKNFDDNYRYKYWYTILGFNGNIVYKSFSGKDSGGSAAHAGEVSDASLKNFKNAIVFPVGWKFDYLSDDHSINAHNFKIQNVVYDKNTGKVNWLTSLNYCDKNFDDDYLWSYDVAVVVSNFGQSREFHRGPYLDNGGIASGSFTINLNALFAPVTWTNGIKDGMETGVDCGGNSPARDMNSCRNSVDPGNGASSKLFSLRDKSKRETVKAFAEVALLEYYQMKKTDLGITDYDVFYSGAKKADRYVEAIASYVHHHMSYYKDGLFGGARSAYDTLTDTGHLSSKEFAGDCEDHAILRAALLRSLGFYKRSIFCADHHNSVDQGQDEECSGEKKGSGGHTFNIVVYKGKYRIMDYEPMQDRFWSNKRARNQHVVDNIWNDHTGKYWSRQDVTPFGGPHPLVNYPGNPCSPSSNWDWRTYFCDITL